jgi:hypothetical protein
MPDSPTTPFSGIFVSYRRDDSSGHAGRLFDRLVSHFGKDRIFMDVDTIDPGEDFVTVIENAVSSCQILIAVIGRQWLTSDDDSSARRLDSPNDFVRLEIATALRRNIRVIPVLVQRANMPKPQDLPDDLAKFLRRNAIELSDLRWQHDVDQLISVMERVLSKRAEEARLAEAAKQAEAARRRQQQEDEKRRVVNARHLAKHEQQRLAEEEANQRAAEEQREEESARTEAEERSRARQAAEARRVEAQQKAQPRRLEEERLARAERERLRRVAEERERQRAAGQAPHASREEVQTDLPTVAIPYRGHRAQPPKRRVLPGITNAAPLRQNRSKLTMLMIMIACVVAIACAAVLAMGALIWIGQMSEESANQNATPEGPQPQTNGNNNSIKDVGPGSGTAIKEIRMAKDKEGQLGDETNTFAPGDRTIHCVVTLQEPKSGTEVKFSWWIVEAGGIRNEKLKDVGYKTNALEKAVLGHLTSTRDWQKGKYKVQVYVNGVLEREFNYTID